MLTVIVTGDRITGKSTLAKRIERFLREDGYDVIVDEPHHERRQRFARFAPREENDGRKVGLIDDWCGEYASAQTKEAPTEVCCSQQHVPAERTKFVHQHGRFIAQTAHGRVFACSHCDFVRHVTDGEELRKVLVPHLTNEHPELLDQHNH